MIAALFVSERGPYVGIPNVDVWGISRDARKYNGPWPVVAHPPCERWGRYWFGGPSARVRKQKGDDGGCFAHALECVRKFGGVLEHPAHSFAWQHFGILSPPMDGGWVSAGDWLGWTCHVEQGHYGHPARKATWLYAVAKELPLLKWGPSGAKLRLDEGFHSAEERARARCWNHAAQAPHVSAEDRHARRIPRSALAARSARRRGMKPLEQMSKSTRHLTPTPFRDLLLLIAGAP